MEIVEKLKKLKSKHNSFFKDFDPKNRLKKADEIISLKRQIDLIHSEIISSILSFRVDYDIIYNNLKSNNLHKFLDKNEAIQNFSVNNVITNSIGYSRISREAILKEFEDLCLEYWSDFIITSQERKSLNDFCKENSIDILTQQNIEEKIRGGINKSRFNVEEIISFYYLNEGLKLDQILKIIRKEYRLQVPIDKVKSVIDSFNNDLSESEVRIIDGSNIICKIDFDPIEIYVKKVDKLNYLFEFEISFITGTSGNFNILISENTIKNSSKERIIEIITDAICYKNSNSDIAQFLEMKTRVRNSILDKINL